MIEQKPSANLVTPPDGSADGYQPPGIAWEEDFEPTGQATGCLSEEGDCYEAPTM